MVRSDDSFNPGFSEHMLQEIESLQDLEDLLQEETISYEPIGTAPPIPYRKSSTYCPNINQNTTLSIFLNVIRNDLRQMKVQKIEDPQVRDFREAVETLKKEDNLTIKAADKGGNIVVMDTEQYKQMCQTILNNNEWYRKVPLIKAEQDKEKYNQLIEAAYKKQIISQTTLKFLQVENPVLQTFYSIPKIHKSRTNPTGRPIVSGKRSLTEKATCYGFTILHTG